MRRWIEHTRNLRERNPRRNPFIPGEIGEANRAGNELAIHFLEWIWSETLSIQSNVNLHVPRLCQKQNAAASPDLGSNDKSSWERGVPNDSYDASYIRNPFARESPRRFYGEVGVNEGRSLGLFSFSYSAARDIRFLTL